MTILTRATNWTNHTIEERAEHCIAFLHTHGIEFRTSADYQRALNRVKAMGDLQREKRHG